MSKLSEIFKGSSKDDHKSVVARIGSLGQKYTDPLAWIFGDDYTGALESIADRSNKVGHEIMKPFEKVDKAINPVRRFVPGVDELGNVVANKPVDAAALAAGAYFAAPAVMSAFGSTPAAGGVTAGSGPGLSTIGGVDLGAGTVGTGGALGGGGTGLGTAGVMEAPVAGSAIGGPGAGASTAFNWQDLARQMGGQKDKQPEEEQKLFESRIPRAATAVSGYVAKYGDALRRLTALTSGAPQSVGGADMGVA